MAQQDDASENSNKEDNPQLSPPADKKEPKQSTPEQTKEELKEAISGAQDVLAEITTPLQIMPVTVTLDRAKVAASKNTIIGSKSLMSLSIADVANVTASTGILFGHIEVAMKTPGRSNEKFGPFWKQDATHFSDVAQGYVIALQRNIDLAALPGKELKNMLAELGKDKNV